MSKDPAFLFYTSDFLTGVADLTMEERGQYITLMCLQHQKGHLSAKTIRLSLGFDLVNSGSDVLSKFSIDEDGNYYNDRLESEIQKRIKIAETHRAVGKLGGRPKNQKGNQKGNHLDNQKANHLGNQIENENVNENDNQNGITFEQFWKLYPRHIAKAEAKKAFSRIDMSADLFNLIAASLEQWKKSDDWTKDSGQFIPYPATWLNGKRWEDEPPKAKQPNKTAPKYKPNNIGNFDQRDYKPSDYTDMFEPVEVVK